MSVVVVVPSIVVSWTAACLASCRIDPARIVVVDNTAANRGVAASWNVGVDHLEAEQADWLVIVSAGVRFGPSGGLDFVAAVEAYDPETTVAVEAACRHDGTGRGSTLASGWHLIAFSRATFAAVGRFDENFYPAYFEDNDFGRRLVLARDVDLDVRGWPTVPVDATSTAGHGHKYGHVKCDGRAMCDYYVRKWGGPPGAETYRTPYGLDVPLSWWEPR